MYRSFKLFKCKCYFNVFQCNQAELIQFISNIKEFPETYIIGFVLYISFLMMQYVYLTILYSENVNISNPKRKYYTAINMLVLLNILTMIVLYYVTNHELFGSAHNESLRHALHRKMITSTQLILMHHSIILYNFGLILLLCYMKCINNVWGQYIVRIIALHLILVEIYSDRCLCRNM